MTTPISPLRLATAYVIGYGTVGTILDAAHEILVEVDPVLAAALDLISNEVMTRFHEEEAKIIELEGFSD